MAMRQPHTMAVVVPAGRDRAGRVRYTHMTYRQLDQDSQADCTRAQVVRDRPRHESRRHGAARARLLLAGVCPVQGRRRSRVDRPGIGLRNFGQCCREAEPEIFIGILKALWARRLLGWGRGSVRQTILVAPGGTGLLGSRFKTLDDVRLAGGDTRRQEIVASASIALLGPDEPAAILFTSGSTGPPKGAVYTHAIFQAQVNAFRSLYAIEPGEIDLCTFPLFALFAPALGMTAIVPDMDPTHPARANPAKIFEAIDDFGVTNLFGSPALLRRLARRRQKPLGADCPRLKRVISAGAPVSPRILEQLAPLLDRPAQIYTPYGATESLPVASIGSGADSGGNPPCHRQRAGRVRRPARRGIDARIIRIQ